MRTILLILSFLLPEILLFGQSDERIKVIRKLVEQINTDSVYHTKKLDNEYFVTIKNEAADGGQELTGYYKNGEIKKIIYSVGISVCMRTFQYYFANNQLIFVFEKEEDNPEVKDSSGQFIGFDYSKPEPAFEGRYYFDKGKLIEIKVKGKKRMSNDANGNKEKVFIDDSKAFLKDLEK